MASSGPPSEIPNLVALIKTLTNPQLKDLLRNEGLAVSGVKASLQLRIIDCSCYFLSLSPLCLPG
jgi:E3 SUMO-protein ligase PIAS1